MIKRLRAWTLGRPRRRSALLAALVVALVPLTAMAAEIATGDTIVISSPVNDDLYVFGNDIVIDSTVDGDVMAFGARVRIYGSVTGDVYAAAERVIVAADVGDSIVVAGNNVDVRGSVGHAVRAAANRLTVETATVDGDLIVAARSVRVDAASRVGGDLVIRAGTARINAPVGGEVRGSADLLRIGGAVDGRIDVRVDTLRFTEGADIAGPVEYTSDHEMLVDGGTTIPTDVTRVEPDHPTASERLQTTIVYTTFRYVWALVLALFLLRIMPGAVRGISDTLNDRPAGSFGWGLLAIILLPLAIAFLLVSVVGIPVALVVLAAFLLALYASQIVVGIVVGDLLAAVSRNEARRGRRST
ncbi:MAG: hypothetical protein ACRD1H_00060, partial [Vicinamibacterales bacterium]